MLKLKRKTIHIALVVILALSASMAKAQQAPIFTNYNNSFSYINAGYAGLSEGVNILGLYRQQWAGFVDNDGNEVAPQTFLLTGDVPIPAIRGGVGLSIMQDKLGFENNINVGIGYSYHLDLGGSTLGIGVAGTLLNRSVNFSSLNPNVANDPLITGLGEESAMLFDFNAGLFWQIPESFYIGVSVVNVLESMTKALNDQSESSASFVTDRTFYAVAGYPFQFEDLPTFTFIPSVGVMSDIASTQVNASFKVLFRDVFTLGANYRPQESVGLMAGFKIKDFHVGYSYDINTMGSGIPGSHEIALSYCFKLDLDRTPRDYRSVRYL
ncbi:MAG: PorP/SprF family type IX secretion system membrane protein [Bacteroidales bacterium]|nr:PorP/SprF family type IX secretion system membrane protein [Bacteroidales bacterium]